MARADLPPRRLAVQRRDCHYQHLIPGAAQHRGDRTAFMLILIEVICPVFRTQTELPGAAGTGWPAACWRPSR
jgi:hypothetical protein